MEHDGNMPREVAKQIDCVILHCLLYTRNHSSRYTLNLGKSVANCVANVVIKGRFAVELLRSAVACNEAFGTVVTPVSSWVAPGADRVALAVEARQSAKSGVLAEKLGAVVEVKVKLIV